MVTPACGMVIPATEATGVFAANSHTVMKNNAAINYAGPAVKLSKVTVL